jgi:hypothetical protein
VVIIDSITKFLITIRKHDSIMVVEDKLTNVTHFVPVKITYKATNIVEIYMKEIARLHGVPKAKVLDQDPKFTSIFWQGLFRGFETNLNLSTSYHLEYDGKAERITQIIEDMLRMYVMDKPFRWEEYIHLFYFYYNYGYLESLKMSLFEVWYGIKCNTPVS